MQGTNSLNCVHCSVGARLGGGESWRCRLAVATVLRIRVLHANRTLKTHHELQYVFGKLRRLPADFDATFVNELVSLGADTPFNVISGLTFGTGDFYEGARV